MIKSFDEFLNENKQNLSTSDKHQDDTKINNAFVDAVIKDVKVHRNEDGDIKLVDITTDNGDKLIIYPTELSGTLNLRAQTESDVF